MEAINNSMSGFKYHREKKQRWSAPISEDQKNYIDMIVAAGEKWIKQNPELPVDAVSEAAYREVLDKEFEILERKIKSAILYATDKLKEMYPKSEYKKMDPEDLDLKD